MFPCAKTILVIRDPRDVMASNQKLTYEPGFCYLDAAFATLASIKTAIAYERDLPDMSYRTVRYEDLVSEPRDTVSVVLQGLGEAWDEDCLNFHKLKNAVQTASVWQVREPFHTKSIGRWRNYKSQFEDIFVS